MYLYYGMRLWHRTSLNIMVQLGLLLDPSVSFVSNTKLLLRLMASKHASWYTPWREIRKFQYGDLWITSHFVHVGTLYFTSLERLQHENQFLGFFSNKSWLSLSPDFIQDKIYSHNRGFFCSQIFSTLLCWLQFLGLGLDVRILRHDVYYDANTYLYKYNSHSS